jgi:hypothetical protein
LREVTTLKKVYEKPDIVFDNFKMSSNIAACAVPVNWNQGTCGKQTTGGITIFASAASGLLEEVCNYDVDIMHNIDIQTQDWNGYCYHVPYEEGALFRS